MGEGVFQVFETQVVRDEGDLTGDELDCIRTSLISQNLPSFDYTIRYRP